MSWVICYQLTFPYQLCKESIHGTHTTAYSTLELIRCTQTQVAVKYNLIGNTSQALEPIQHLTSTVDD